LPNKVLRAITRAVSPAIARCELTYLKRQPIDYALAVRQHAAYEDALRSLGVEVIQSPAAPGLPDAVFVEDTCVVMEHFVIIAQSAVASRRDEINDVAPLVSGRALLFINPPGTLEGGDVLRIGRTFYVGRSSRSNEIGIRHFGGIVKTAGCRVAPVEIRDCLHLKTACSFLGDNTVLLNPKFVSPAAFSTFKTISVKSDANVLCIGGTVLVSAAAEETRKRVEAAGFTTRSLDISEFQKAEGGLSCLSLLFEV
jgi:dimethylargininase